MLWPAWRKYVRGRRTKKKREPSKDDPDEHRGSRGETSVIIVKSPVSASGRQLIGFLSCNRESTWHYRAPEFRGIRVRVSPPGTALIVGIIRMRPPRPQPRHSLSVFFLSRIICCVEVPCCSIVAYRIVSSICNVRFACLFGPLCHSQ